MRLPQPIRASFTASPFFVASTASGSFIKSKKESTTENIPKDGPIPKHRNIASLRDVILFKHPLTPLTELIRRGQLTDSQIHSYAQQLVDVFDFCHRQGVYHNNLQADFLFIDTKGTLKVTGFGSLGITRSVYSAPELIAKEEYSCEKIDAWSCGIILHLMLMRTLPDPIRLHRGELIFSGDAADLIAQLLSLDPAYRPSLHDSARHPWFTESECEPKLMPNSDVEFKQLIIAALPGRPDIVVEKIASKLANVDVENRDDLKLLASLFKSPRRLALWLEEKSRLPAFASLRIAGYLFKFL